MRISRLRRAVATLACATAVVAGGTACTPAEPEKTPTPTRTAIFASEDEALQAAVDVYQQYNAAFFEMTSDPDAGSEKLKPLLTTSFYEELTAGTYLEDKGQRTVGTASFGSASMVTLDQNVSSASMTVRLCQDLTNVQIVDAEGNDVTPPERLDIFPVEVALVWNGESNKLLIEDEGSWRGENFCGK
ncbi:hypothetical protein [Paramicrobacterium agarici]|uniref:hypothetical protein n=1 Tax=Paramicrobacterium agarici TaxID=630514 RepID=UPI001153D49E|nr:hypothetical protein [Microbacterium agarici]TQO23400.1 hypothetical protein FB385_2250 [Microbacterium agarici]